MTIIYCFLFTQMFTFELSKRIISYIKETEVSKIEIVLPILSILLFFYQSDEILAEFEPFQS
jgi:hypothetical protein